MSKVRHTEFDPTDEQAAVSSRVVAIRMEASH